MAVGKQFLKLCSLGILHRDRGGFSPLHILILIPSLPFSHQEEFDAQKSGMTVSQFVGDSNQLELGL